MRFVLGLLAVLAGLAVGLAAVVGINAPIGNIVIDAATPAGSAQPLDWKEVLADPTDLKVTAFVTGWVEAGPEILIDATNPRMPDAYRNKIWVPSIAYLVEHPAKGRVLLDTGLKAGNCAYGTEPLYWVPCRNAAGSDTVSQLASHGLKPSDLRYVVISHFHGDHVSGLGALIRAGATRLISSHAEIEAVNSGLRVVSGYESSMLKENFSAMLIDPMLTPMPIVGQAADFFGDGSLWLIPAPGHTAGQLAAVINAKGQPLLLTFDASHLKAGFDLAITPGMVVDRPSAESSLAKLRALADAFPQIKVIYGHEPSQWDSNVTRVTLAGR